MRNPDSSDGREPDSVFYLGQAREQQRLAETETLRSRRLIHVKAAARWLALGERAKRVERKHAQRPGGDSDAILSGS